MSNNKFILIADSGGTKTDWCCVTSSGEMEFFTTGSYHPRYVDALAAQNLKEFWSKYTAVEGLELHFYGAGCLAAEQNAKMTSFFLQLGFKNIRVSSDIYAAGLAMNGGDGWGAICGTGSVAFEMHNRKLVRIHGGLGRELGDEGSGYYFGKLIAQRIVSGQLKMIDFPELYDVELIPENYAHLPKLLASRKEEPQLKEIHKENILLFAKAYLSGCNELSFCGSYAFHHQSAFQEALAEAGIGLKVIIERPIENLAAFFLHAK